MVLFGSFKKETIFAPSSYNISYQERLRDMARRSLDNLLKLGNQYMRSELKVRCQLQPDGKSGQISQISA
jgi:hypothetical protein